MSERRNNLPLCVVMPVFNEAGCVEKVVRDWLECLRCTVGSAFNLLVLNDGSTDGTPAVLDRLAAENPEISVVHKKNSGHGQTCKEGYRIAVERGAHWVLQIDSDGQCDTKYFADFWKIRESHPVIFGFRAKRDDGVIRWLISRVVSVVAYLGCGTWVRDANVPYRLVRKECLLSVVPDVPASVYLANILVSVLLEARFGIHWIDIGFRNRLAGNPSVKARAFARHGLRLLKELRAANQLGARPVAGGAPSLQHSS